MNTIELTPAELDLIQVKRQQEELAAKEAEAKKQLAIENEIKRAQTQVDGYVKKNAEQVKATAEFAALVPNSVVVVDTRSLVHNTNYAGKVVNAIKYADTTSHLTLNGYTIQVKEHIVYGKWSYRGSSKGYKMYVSGPGIDYKTSQRGYKNGKKVVELIEETIEQRQAQELYKNKQKNAVETAVANLMEQFPTAKVESGRGCRINPYASASNRYTEYDKIDVTLENGVQIEYQVYASGELTRMKVAFPNTDAMEFIAQMNNLEFTKK